MIACWIGLLRSTIAVIGDFNQNLITNDFYTDLLFLFVFIYTLTGLHLKLPYQRVVILFFVPFIFLLVVSFVQARGIASSLESHLFAGAIIIAFTTRGKLAYLFGSLLIVGTIVGLVIVELEYRFIENYIIGSDNSKNFMFSSIGIIIFTLFAKRVLNRRREKLSETFETLIDKSEQTELKNQQLLLQREELEQLTEQLNNLVTTSNREIKDHNKRMAEYLSVTINELFDSYQRTIEIIDGLKVSQEGDSMNGMIVKSGDNLRDEMEDLRMKIEEGIHE